MDNKVLATVNGVDITENEFNRVAMSMPREQQAFIGTPQGREQLLEQLIQVQLYYDYGLETKVEESDIFKEQIEIIKKDLIARIAMDNVAREAEITEDDIKRFYEKNTKMFKKGATVEASHVLVDSEEKAIEVKKEISQGLSFSEAAKKYSTCPSKDAGGSLGEFGKGQMVHEFEEVAFNSAIGEISEPVKTQFGYHIIKVTKKNDASELSYDEVKEQIRSKVLQERMQYRVLGKAEELKEKYKVEYKNK